MRARIRDETAGKAKRERRVAQNGSDAGPLVAGMAGRYASALFDLARDERQIDEVAAGLDRFDALLKESADLRRLVKSPVFTAEQQAAAIAAVIEKAGVTGLAANFIRLTAANRRLFALPGMITAFRALVQGSKGIVRAEVRVAEKPSDAVLEEITASLRDIAKSEVAVDLHVDPSLIGGLVVKMGSRMVDASLRTKLNGIRLAMREAR
ncbi:ATP synthase subunit delta [Methylobacterium gregans]|uniref:ATP synthase subunit delta n=1 Tax=Methylobacterium gregans TaxID=374424 RepID=A0AA37HKF8_9HYPH|nr:ATP synthase subunit delta [Methylobacterium gregans]GLS55734.1 ATP synthase subunit delta [Methylobacterium gregans]